VLDAGQRAVERGVARRPGCGRAAVADLAPTGRTAVATLIADGLIDGRAALAGRAALTVRGRLLADAVVRALTP